MERRGLYEQHNAFGAKSECAGILLDLCFLGRVSAV